MQKRKRHPYLSNEERILSFMDTVLDHEDDLKRTNNNALKVAKELSKLVKQVEVIKINRNQLALAFGSGILIASLVIGAYSLFKDNAYKDFYKEHHNFISAVNYRSNKDKTAFQVRGVSKSEHRSTNGVAELYVQ